MTSPWHTLTAEAFEQELQSDIDRGLTTWNAQHWLATVGPNPLPEAAPPSPLKIFLIW
jgi:hypothetical protein